MCLYIIPLHEFSNPLLEPQFIAKNMWSFARERKGDERVGNQTYPSNDPNSKTESITHVVCVSV